jgi:NAD(P)-dependent dehydrogenase (short-subunit alcohol dehydrogenase family)
MYTKAIDLEDFQNEKNYNGSIAYAKAKRMQIVMTEHWADTYGPLGVGAHAMHPGWAATPGVSDALPGFERIMKPLLRTAEEGADTIVWLTSASESDLGPGGFWLDRRRRPTSYIGRTRTSDADAVRVLERIADLATARSELLGS